jgi:hypothetical protein
MGNNQDSKKLRSVTINLGDSEGRIEETLPKETGPAKIRISCWNQGRSLPMDISQNELVILLQKAIRAGVLSPEFLEDLHSAFEI